MPFENKFQGNSRYAGGNATVREHVKPLRYAHSLYKPVLCRIYKR